MRRATSHRATAIVLLVATIALAPAIAEAQRRGGGGGGGGRGGGGGGGGFRSAGVSSISRGSGGGMRSGGMSGASARQGGGYSGGARASTRPSGDARGNFDRSGDRMANSGNRVNSGDRMANSGNRVNSGDRTANSGNRNRVNTGNINTGNVNVNTGNVGDGRYDWDDHYHPVAGAMAIGAVAGITAAAIGSTMYALPPSCSPYPYNGYSYYRCGSAYYETRYEGDKVVYVTVEQPQ